MVVNKATVETTVKFTWTVNNFSDLMYNCNDGKLYSPSFFTGPHPCGSLMTMEEFLNANYGFLVNDTCIIVAEVSLNDIDASFGSELVYFKGVGKVEKDYVELLEKSCSKHPSLIQSLVKKNRSQGFIQRGFTALGRVLHFLNTKKLKDMINDDDACKELQDLWDELVVFGFDDLTWLEPHVKSALSMKGYVESEQMVTKLKGDVVDLEDKIKSLKANVAAAKSDLEGTKLQLATAEKGFVKRNLNDELDHGLS
ncbi:hypothetical protein PIB30_068982 [Stylosanthes scabra]|uniref:MATH domain-containing protein n=1 Tax=Stylosanthes scabra TaxID=79078 RepID=A0ABU6QN05_9FABA|nr:hypothetical protein [Stylosanthes scabra]